MDVNKKTHARDSRDMWWFFLAWFRESSKWYLAPCVRMLHWHRLFSWFAFPKPDLRKLKNPTTNFHPWKWTAGSPKNHPIEKEHHLNEASFFVWFKMWIFQGETDLSGTHGQVAKWHLQNHGRADDIFPWNHDFTQHGGAMNRGIRCNSEWKVDMCNHAVTTWKVHRWSDFLMICFDWVMSATHDVVNLQVRLAVSLISHRIHEIAIFTSIAYTGLY